MWRLTRVVISNMIRQLGGKTVDLSFRRYGAPLNMSACTFRSALTFQPKSCNIAGMAFGSVKQSSGSRKAFLANSAFRALALSSELSEDEHSQDLKIQAETQNLGIKIPEYCPGCGVKMQDEDSDKPGFFTVPKTLLSPEPADIQDLQEEFMEITSPDGKEKYTLRSVDGTKYERIKTEPIEIGDSGESVPRTKEDLIENIEETSTSGREEILEDAIEIDEPRVLCARCYSLQHHGKVKSQKAESLMPGFDLGVKVGRKMALQKFRRPIVLCVVDLVDFDGSLPIPALLSILPESMLNRGKAIHKNRAPIDRRWNAERSGGIQECRFVVVANKSDLLPIGNQRTEIENWIRRRLGQAGLPKPDSINLVSSTRRLGMSHLLSQIQESAGIVGDVWVVGAQNAGKSTLINALRRTVGRNSQTKDVTTAAFPGTTLGTLRVDGILGGRCRMFDTPGVPHTHQISSLLNPDEVRMVLPRAPIKPRSFRIGPGQTIHLGGLARVDVIESSSATLYLTLWMSNDIPFHYGRIDKIERASNLIGTELVPPLGPERKLELGSMIPHNISVEGESWQKSSLDIAIAGLGWIAVGTGGQAELKVWTYPGIAITKREAILRQYSKTMEKTGLGNKHIKLQKDKVKRFKPEDQNLAKPENPSEPKKKHTVISEDPVKVTA